MHSGCAFDQFKSYSQWMIGFNMGTLFRVPLNGSGSLSCGSIVLYVIANHPRSKDIHLHCLVFRLSLLCPCFHLLIFPSLAPFALLFRPVQGLITFIMVSIRATEYRVIKVENSERERDGCRASHPWQTDRTKELKNQTLYRSERDRRSQCFFSLTIRRFHTQSKVYEVVRFRGMR